MAIPEFVLKKLVKPGSLKKEGEGFSFVLKNTFAPATITQFDLFVGEIHVSSENILLESDGIPPQMANQISPDYPALTPVGVEILIKVFGQPLNNTVKIKALTKEVGDIVFSLDDSNRRKKYKSLKNTYFSWFKKPLKISLNIDFEKVTAKADPFLLGQFVEHLERCVYDGIWDTKGNSIRSDTLDLIQQLNPPLIRYPGGNFASGYHWEDGIGPKNKRPCRHDAAWQAEETNQIGTDEFLAFCEQIGTVPLLVVNDGSGTAEEAAKWVEYCNSPKTTVQGARRAENGHPAPYNVKYWGIGNEVWGAWQIGTTSAGEYVRRLLRFVDAMKKIDPEIKIVAVGNHPLTDSSSDPATLWNQEILTKAGGQIDFLSWHIYQPEKNGWQEEYDPQELFKTICAAPLDIEIYATRIEKQIKQFAPGKPIKQALDEWNVWLPPLKGETSMHQVTYTMRDALYAASALSVFYRNSDKFGMTNLAQLVNVLPLIKTDEKQAIATSIFYPFILFNKMEMNVMNLSSNSPSFSSQALGENISSHSDVPYLDALACCDDKKQRITILLVNRHLEKRMEVIVPFDPQSNYSCSQVLTISANHPLAANTFSNPYKVRLTEEKYSKFIDGKFQISIKPFSITFLEVIKNVD